MKPPHSIQITAVGSYAPSKVITNDEMAELVDTNDEWIKSHTGIAERHIAEKGELTSDLAYKAIEDLFKRGGRNAGEIDGIVVATATPDFP
ncbi:MAG: 3-oxoacyl-ACP synthase, partial [Sphaerochaeta sp.]|nr:3-oxoacyl-ACP synthase [Sphaerochaeta sp.]